MTKEPKDKILNSNDRSIKEHIKQCWEYVVDWLDKNDKVAVAISTIVIAAFTVILAIATGFLFWSAEKSADAAKKSADIAERALIAGQRAFVSVTSFKTVGHLDHKTGKVTSWSFAPVWTNAGDTPTRNMTNHVSLQPFDREMPDAWDFPDIWGPQARPVDRVPSPIGISPKNSIEGQTIKISLDVVDAVIAGKRALYMWGWAVYSDVFPETDRHITRFAVQIFIGGDPRDPKRISFDYLFIKKYNCSDEECVHQGYPAPWIARQLEITSLK